MKQTSTMAKEASEITS